MQRGFAAGVASWLKGQVLLPFLRYEQNVRIGKADPFSLFPNSRPELGASMPDDEETSQEEDLLSLLADDLNDPRVERLISAYRGQSESRGGDETPPMLEEALSLYEEGVSETN